MTLPSSRKGLKPFRNLRPILVRGRRCILAIATLVVFALVLLQLQIIVDSTSSNANKGLKKSAKKVSYLPLSVNRIQDVPFSSRKHNDPDPFVSNPPKAIPLYNTTLPLRHECLVKIRQRQVETLGKLFTGYSRVLLVDPAYHKNVGDHMLTLGELTFLKSIGFPDDAIAQCSYLQGGSHLPACRDVLVEPFPVPTIALWHAGGNWGDIWKEVHVLRSDSFRDLLKANLTVISMPQSLYFRDEQFQRNNTRHMQNAIESSISNKELDRITFTWREKESFEKAARIYPFAKNLVVPDIAFQLGPYHPMPPTDAPLYDLVLFLRDDRESKDIRSRDRLYITELLKSIAGDVLIDFVIVDWSDRLYRFESQDVFFTDTSIQLLSLGRVVVCDRLHAAILAYLSGLPFVYLDQSTGKITKTLRTAFDTWDGCQRRDEALWGSGDDLRSALALGVSFLEKYGLRDNRKRRKGPVKN